MFLLIFLKAIFTWIINLQKIICMKWGNRYDYNFVNRLYSSIKKHTKRPTTLYCFTDDPIGVNKEIKCKPLPYLKIPSSLSFTPWRKLSIWQDPLEDLKKDVLFLDLDLVITGNLDRFFDFNPGKFCVIENWTQKGSNIGNTSCFKLPIGKYPYIFKNFEDNPQFILKKYKIEQTYISREIEEQFFWPQEWCKSFKHDLLPTWPLRIWKAAKLPENTSIVAFTGKPDPNDVIEGNWPVPPSKFYKKIYKRFKIPHWVRDNWK